MTKENLIITIEKLYSELVLDSAHENYKIWFSSYKDILSLYDKIKKTNFNPDIHLTEIAAKEGNHRKVYDHIATDLNDMYLNLDGSYLKPYK